MATKRIAMKYETKKFLKVILTIDENKKSNKAIPINVVLNKYLRTYVYLKGPKPRQEYRYIDTDDILQVNTCLHELQKLGFIQIKVKKGLEYRKDALDSAIQNIKVVQEHLEEAYAYLDNTAKSIIDEKIIDRINNFLSTVRIEWMQSFLSDELQYFQKEKKLHSKYWKTIDDVEDILKILSYIQSDQRSYMRQMSQKLYNDSKYFEQKVKSKFINIVKAYEPYYQMNEVQGNELIESEIFAYLGLISYPQVFTFYGNVDIYYIDGRINNVRCRKGSYYIDSDTMQEIKFIDCLHSSCLICIENKANYIDYIRNHAKENEFIIYAQGHYSPQKAMFYKLFKNINVPIYLWSDIDLGGFYMYMRMKELFSNIKPYRMDRQTYLTYEHTGKLTTPAYEEKLIKLLENDMYSIFHDVIHEILKHHKTIEQEVMIEDMIISSINEL